MICACGHDEVWHDSKADDCLAPCIYPGCGCHTFDMGPKGSDAQDLKPSTEASVMEGLSPVASSDLGPRTNPRKPRLPK